jgi:hypothetical protein
VVKELWPGPYWPVPALLTKTGSGVLVQEDALSRLLVAEAVSSPRQ